MDKVVSFSKGRLGNIMFCVASGKYYADKHNMDFYLLRNDSHDNYLSKYEKTFFNHIKMVDSYDPETFEVVKERKSYDPVIRNTRKNLYIDGYRECPRYWNEDKEYIYNLFKPEPGIIDAIKKVYDLDFTQYISINVRRGDYLKEDVKKRLGLLKRFDETDAVLDSIERMIAAGNMDSDKLLSLIRKAKDTLES